MKKRPLKLKDGSYVFCQNCGEKLCIEDIVDWQNDRKGEPVVFKFAHKCPFFGR